MKKMKIIIGILLLVVTSAAAYGEESQKPDSSCGTASTEYYIIETTHRIHTGFRQVDSVGFGEIFYVGEDEYEAEIIVFNPHLGITMEGEALQMSDTLYNPAARIRVSVEGEVIQESWGFHFVDSPHFYREDKLGFKLLEYNVDDKYIKPANRK